jgi:hypothetical protein
MFKNKQLEQGLGKLFKNKELDLRRILMLPKPVTLKLIMKNLPLLPILLNIRHIYYNQK